MTTLVKQIIWFVNLTTWVRGVKNRQSCDYLIYGQPLYVKGSFTALQAYIIT